MQRTILTITFLLVACFCSRAQVYIGPSAGGHLSWMKFDSDGYREAFDVRPIVGYHAGGTVSMKVRNRFLLHASVVYSAKGKRVEGRADPLLRNRVRYDYLEMPVIYAVDFRARIGRGKEFKYYLGAGPNISYWLGGKGSLYNTDLEETAELASRDLSYKVVFRQEEGALSDHEMNVARPNRFQLGLNAAAGVVFEPRPTQRMLLMLRYELGHSFLSRTSNGKFTSTYYEDILQSRNKGLHLTMAYLFDLKVGMRKKGKSTSRIGRSRR